MSKTLDFDDCFIVVFEIQDAIRLHQSLNRIDAIMALPTVTAHLRDLLNDYTGLDDKAH